jgi:hypothetical protein
MKKLQSTRGHEGGLAPAFTVRSARTPLKLFASPFFVNKALLVGFPIAHILEKTVREEHRKHKQRGSKYAWEQFHSVGLGGS